MFNIRVLILISYFIGTTIAIPKNTQIDLILQDLEENDWLDDETQCIKDILNILNNVKNHTLWAVWIWNSMQHPTGTFYGSRYSLGNYDQCMKAPSVTGQPKIITQYCLVDVKLTDKEGVEEGDLNAFGRTDEYLEVKSKVGRHRSTITWGTCLPASCKPHSVTKILKTVYSVNPLTSAKPRITIDNCQDAGEKTVYNYQFYMFLAIVASLVAAAISSTIYLQYVTKDTKMTRVAYALSLKRNWSSLTRVAGDEIPVLNCAKSLHIFLTTCGHSFVFVVMGAISNGSDFDYYLTEKDNVLENFVQHLDLPTIENFIIISGLLVMKGLLEKNNPMVSLIQRYIRLIGSLAFLVFYTIAVSEYTGDGPLWKKLAGRDVKACEENWIWNILMLNNYVNTENVCQLVSWYVPCDYHLTVMGTVLYCIWRWNKQVGKVVTVLISVFALVLPGVATYWKRIPGILMYEVDRVIEMRTNVVYVDTYVKSHYRAGPYLIGMATGYILTVYKPAQYRKVISKGWSYAGIIVASLIGLRVVTSAAAWCLGDYDAWNSAIYAAFNRNIWAVAFCACVIIAEYGDLSEIQSIIAWPGFTIFSRLAYGIYITHSLILLRNIYSQRNPMQYDTFSFLVNGLGVLVVSSVFAVLLWLFVEAPFSNLTNLLLVPKRQAKTKAIAKHDEWLSVDNEKKNKKQI